jgi:hypothetical protein
LEFQSWYGKVTGDDMASAYVLHPLQTSFVSIYERLDRLRWTRETELVDNLS